MLAITNTGTATAIASKPFAARSEVKARPALDPAAAARFANKRALSTSHSIIRDASRTITGISGKR